MNKPENSLTNQIRKAVTDAGAAGITLYELYEITDHIFPADKRKIKSRIYDLVKRSKEIERISQGKYRAVKTNKKNEPGVAHKIWNLLRIRYKKGNLVTTDDLVTICGASNDYAREKMQLFTRLGITQKTGLSAWRMIQDPVTMPVDKGKIDRLQKIRDERKNAYLKSLDTLLAATVDARMAAVEFNNADAEVDASTAG